MRQTPVLVGQVSDAAYGWGVEAGGVVEVVPGFVAFAWEDGRHRRSPW